MNELTRILGSIILGLLLYSIPILVTCSLALNWDGKISFALIILALCQVFFLCAFIYNETEK